jgi:lysyl-tRNA synthetase class 1
MLRNFDRVQEIMLPSLREERASTYSPFLPIHPVTRVVMQVPLTGMDPDKGVIRWADPATSEEFETPVTGGHCKLQWKPDWAMRWYALKVDYEMAGKDLIDSVKLSSRIVRALGGEPPDGFNYELFLDEKGQKISKSKGNGLTIDEWLTYASPESLSLFMFQKPTAAKRLHFDVIPRTVDDYLGFLDSYPRQEWKERLGNPVWHIHSGEPPAAETLTHGHEAGASVSFAMLLNLAAVANSDSPDVLWGFLRRYAPAASPQNHPRLDRLVGYACAYFRDFVAPKKRYRAADDIERAALEQVSELLGRLPADATAEDIQHALYDVARPMPRYQDLKAKGATPERPGVSNEFFNMIYAVLLGEERGPRLGSFIALYGIAETRALIARALAGELVKAA